MYEQYAENYADQLKPYIDRIETCAGLLPLLPQEFTRDDVRALRIAQGMKPDPTALINKWGTRKQVLRDAERGAYVKT